MFPIIETSAIALCCSMFCWYHIQAVCQKEGCNDLPLKTMKSLSMAGLLKEDIRYMYFSHPGSLHHSCPSKNLRGKSGCFLDRIPDAVVSIGERPQVESTTDSGNRDGRLLANMNDPSTAQCHSMSLPPTHCCTFHRAEMAGHQRQNKAKSSLPTCLETVWTAQK